MGPFVFVISFKFKSAKGGLHHFAHTVVYSVPCCIVVNEQSLHIHVSGVILNPRVFVASPGYLGLVEICKEHKPELKQGVFTHEPVALLFAIVCLV
jgi:hypothetical protein